jgi:hypothetical protein
MLTKQITAGDILINEVLFSPRQGGVEFVEIYNNSSNSLDLKDLFLTTDRNNVLTNLHPITPVSYIIKANQYLVLSTNPDQVKAHYHTENPNAFLRMKSLPPFTDKGKTIILISNSIPIDQFDYDENMHFKLIKDQKGVSLERSSFNRPANEPGNFRSATSSVGFATPGYKNSQYMGPITSNEEFTLKSKTFSPDNDGFEDLMHINYKFPEPPGVATINIYNAQGMLVRRLVKNQTLAAEGTIYWNGLDEQNKQATVGIYIIHTEIFDLNGNVKRYRKPCVLATKLN